MKIRLIALAITSLCAADVYAVGPILQSGKDPYRPLYESTNQPPLNLLTLSRDHKLWYEAYNDASDLDGDGIYDVGYKGWKLKAGASTADRGNFQIDYYGYFDSYKCYLYSTSNARFEPVIVSNTKKCTTSTGRWSGDYLNYLTTSRIDAIRKVLYGGTRSTDSASDTVLQRAFVPQDAHSWGKEYDPANELNPATGTVYYRINDYTPLDQPASGKRILFANATWCGSSCSTSYNSAPQLRYIENSAYRIWEWLSIERPVADTDYATGANVRVKVADQNPGYPIALTVRVQVCKTNLLEDNCKKYGTSNKPVGLLQQYGDNDAMRFGLLTGSYSHNIEGGVLRKNIGKIDDEVDQTNGTFKAVPVTSGSIITTINNLRIEGFQNTREYFTGTYDTACSYANAFASQLTDGNCSAWGNPVGEMMFESMRYLAGTGSPTSGYATDTKGATLSLPEPSWTDPYGIVSGTTRRNNVCSKAYITLLADINPNFDGNVSTTTINGTSFNPNTMMDTLWTFEYGSGTVKSVLIGENGTDNNQAPTPKDTSSFKNLKGLPDEPGKKGTFMTAAVAAFARTNDINPAPETQTVNTFAVALASPFPKISVPVNNKIITIVPFAKTAANGGGSTGSSGDYRPTDQIVDFYVDTIRNIPGYPNDTSVNGGRAYYKFRINYEDVEYGGDHDMDAIAEYTVSLLANNTVQVTVNSTYAAGGQDQHMGYVVSGTTKDGVYLVVKDVGGADVNYWMDAKPATTGNPSGDPISPQGKLTALTDTRTFSVSTTGSTVTELKSPLWYAAKYGGFIDNEAVTDTANYNRLDDVSEWDADGDGVPDNYFLVTNPLRLKEQLDKAFSLIDSTSRASGAVGSSGGSASTSADLRIYRTSYKTDDWSGNLQAYGVDVSTLGNTGILWSAADGSKLRDPADRNIYTFNPASRAAVLFSSNSTETNKLSATQKAALNKNSAGTIDNKIAERINYLRGDATNEGTAAGKFRVREQSGTQSNYIADILDATPISIGSVNINYYSQTDNDYPTFAANTANTRDNMVYTGANGGMLHGFKDNLIGVQPTDNGEEKIAYVPSFVYDKLNALDNPSYAHEFYLNGAMAAGDIWTGTAWKTILATTAGYGGKGVAVLNVTDPAQFTASNASNVVMWEYFNTTVTTQGDPDMGYQPVSPLVVRMNDGKFRVVVGNGFNSNNGNAVLYLLDANGPGSGGWDSNSVIKLQVTSPNTGANGLAGPTGADLNNDGKVDIIYAGDLKGNLWKFDVRSKTPSDWSAAPNATTPLFTAKSAAGALQPIVTAPAVEFHPTQNTVLDVNNDGVPDNSDVTMVFFGTGKFIADCDVTTTGCTGEATANTFYGIWDRNAAISTGRAALLKQTIGSYDGIDVALLNTRLGTTLTASDVANSRCIKPVNAAGVPQSCAADPTLNKVPQIDWTTQKGWYVDLPLSGERHVGMPRIASNIVIFNTLAPGQQVNSCAFTAVSSLMALNYENGGQTTQRFDVKTADGSVVGGIPNVGVISNDASPNGTTTASGAKASGLNDERGFGRNYATASKKTSKVIDIDTKGPPKLIKTFRTVTPISWREVIQ